MAGLSTLSPAALRACRWGLIGLGLLPLARLLVGWPLGWLGANPIEFVTRSTGTWTLVALLLTLTITPLRRWTGWHWLLRLRRTAGLLTFFYACLHLLTYVGFDRFFDLADIVQDIVQRPFIAVGMAAFALLVPLALTSNNRAVRALGAARWQRLHYAVYPIAVLACLHYLWLARRDPDQPLIYMALFAVLFAARIVHALRARRG